MLSKETPKGDNQANKSRINRIMLFLYTFGAISALIGLVEVMRLVASYWRVYGMLANFPLETSIYFIGIGWIIFTFYNFVNNNYL